MGPAFVHIPLVQSNLRRDIAVSAQNCWVKGNGAYTGEIRCMPLQLIRHKHYCRAAENFDHSPIPPLLALLSAALYTDVAHHDL